MTKAMTPEEAAAGMMKNPVDHFHHSPAEMHSLPRAELEAMQLAGLRRRFAELRDNIPILKKLCDEQNLHSIEDLQAVVPALFNHTVYKSYPLVLLEKGNFKQLTRWLNKLTTVDLSGLDVSHCSSIDEWIGTLDKMTPIRIRHSSGTTGAMSFIPRTKHEADRHFFTFTLGQFDFFSQTPPQPGKPLSMHIVIPNFRSGHTAILRTNEYYFEHIAGGDEAKAHFLYPFPQSSDVMFLAGRLRAAQAKGELDRLELSPTLLKRKEEFERQQRNMASDMKTFFSDVVHNLRGERVYTFGTWNVLYNIAKAGLEEGIEGVFSPDSVMFTGGGAKGQVVPDNWEESVKKFFGVRNLLHGYGMTEVMGQFRMCSHERFHLEPWIILYVIDPDTGQPYPREGVQTGRAAFYDLMADTYWGGFVSGDEVTVDWSSTCGCGRLSPHLSRKIERYSEKRGGDDKISCAAAADAHVAALNYLTETA